MATTKEACPRMEPPATPDQCSGHSSRVLTGAAGGGSGTCRLLGFGVSVSYGQDGDGPGWTGS